MSSLVWIMLPRAMKTRSAGQVTAAPRGGRTGGRIGRRGGRTRGRYSDQGNGEIYGQGGQGDVRNVIANNDRRGCTYKEFLACNPKEYDGKGGAIVYTRWIEKMESVKDMSGCEVNQKVKYTAGSFVEPSKDRNVRDENKGTMTGNAFALTTNLVKRENTGHFSKDCRVVPRNVNTVNARNPAAARGACYECRSTDHYKSACPRGRAFMLGAEEARQVPNIMTGMLNLNDHYATTLFDSGADYSFVSTTFIPLLTIKPSDLGFSYEIEIAS
ncbi:hypothetical protein Tco_1564409 [Tanacetum coccineum]